MTRAEEIKTEVEKIDKLRDEFYELLCNKIFGMKKSVIMLGVYLFRYGDFKSLAAYLYVDHDFKGIPLDVTVHIVRTGDWIDNHPETENTRLHDLSFKNQYAIYEFLNEQPDPA